MQLSFLLLLLPYLAIAHRTAITNFGPDLQHRSFVTLAQARHLPNPRVSPAETQASPLRLALNYLHSHGLHQNRDFLVTSSYSSANSVTHVYLKQIINDIQVENGVMNLNVKNGEIISIGSSFHGLELIDQSDLVSQQVSKIGILKQPELFTIENDFTPLRSWTDPRIKQSPIDAVLHLSRHLNLPLNPDLISLTSNSEIHDLSTEHFRISGIPFGLKDVPVSLKYIQTETGQLSLVWDIELEMKDNWYHAHVSAEDGLVHSLIDWVSDASYEVFPFGVNDPTQGDRQLVRNPEHPLASPLGWHNNGREKFWNTQGNNVIAHENIRGKLKYEKNHRPISRRVDDLIFDFFLDLRHEPEDYIDASITNLFYWNNIIHDFFYVYGFDEDAGNFQENNRDKGGIGGDPVIANAQDGSGYSNANFATPPDGRSGKMRMYIWDVTDPMRDGDLDGGIIMHEYSHGVTQRLTGGPANVGCLGWGESGGMGEGWGDFFATIVGMTKESHRNDSYTIASYANGGSGIRHYPYSSSTQVNPTTYGYIKKESYWGVHSKGEIWAQILYEVYWNMVEKHGFTDDWFNPIDKSSSIFLNEIKIDKFKRRKYIFKERKQNNSGNVLVMQLVIDGLKLQPCYPTFIDARDAILHADEINNKGENLCLLWNGFARRGLGLSAASGGNEAFDVPDTCQE